jgi:DMSO/TMAO reductase YedYZ molybdopterin-dependent catalytic subunit
MENLKASVALFFLVVFAGCIQGGLVDSETGTPLAGVEVREYQGENLSSVNDFRENSIAGPQYIDENAYRLRVTGLVREEKEYTYGEAMELPAYKKVVTLNCVEGWSAKILWEGILLTGLLEKSGPLENANTVIFRAHDGYSTSLPLDYIKGNSILLAYKMNGITLPPERGFPFQLVAESKWGYKWIKWVEEIELSDDPGFRGYWESNGYSNQGDLDKSFLGG